MIRARTIIRRHRCTDTTRCWGARRPWIVRGFLGPIRRFATWEQAMEYATGGAR
ncbi:MAG: hypothetical protein ACO1ON_12970 [Nocardioides sp.]